MTDYKEKFEKWQRETKERFEEIDKQLGLKDKLEEGAKVVAETAQKGAEVLRENVQKIKSEAEKSEVGKQAVKTAGETAKKAWEASEPLRDAAGDASEKAADAFGKTAVEAEKTIKTASRRAGEVIGAAGAKAATVFEEARGTFESAASGVSKAFNLGANWTRAFDSTFKTVQKTGNWIAENPSQAVATGASMAVGASLGVVFTGISSHWLFNSALPAWSVKKLGEQFNEYLKTQEELITKGELSKAEAERIEFERDHKKFVAGFETNQTVAEKPDAFEQWVAAQKPVERRTGDRFRVQNIRHHHRA
jgi:ElaB/YqjD/DUF883 family membrane-anchored ribosome-binding protein